MSWLEDRNPLEGVAQLVLTPGNSKFARFLEETLEFLQNHSEIIETIRDDQDRHAKQKKQQRIEDTRWERNQQPALEGIQHAEEDVPEVQDLSLKQGRPRKMSPVVTYVFLMVRCYWGGVSTRETQDIVEESRTLEVLLENLGIESRPARSTISEHVNCISNGTRRLIHEKLLCWIGDQDLDTFEEMMGDTTAVWANTAFPNDASIILKLAERVWERGSSLDELDERVESYQRHWTEYWLGRMRKIQFEIQTTNHDGTYKKHYRELYKNARKLHDHLRGEAEEFEQRWEPEAYPPSLRRRIRQVQQANREDLEALQKVMDYSRKRVLEGKSTPAKKKVLSLGDEDAAWIEKGGREPVIGYRPLVTRSGEGFATGLSVRPGNPSDSKRMQEAVDLHETATGVCPRKVTLDDGFADQTQLENLLGRDPIEEICISGSRGKRMMSEERWESEEYQQMRRDRSAVESLIFTLKYGFSFGRLARRGLEAVRAELLEDMIGYNFCHMLRVRERQNEPENVPKAT